MKRWQYKVGQNLSDPTLNDWGQDGWELIQVLEVNGIITYFFKRQWIVD
jgi:hypothetical protein